MTPCIAGEPTRRTCDPRPGAKVRQRGKKRTQFTPVAAAAAAASRLIAVLRYSAD